MSKPLLEWLLMMIFNEIKVEIIFGFELLPYFFNDFLLILLGENFLLCETFFYIVLFMNLLKLIIECVGISL